MSSAVPKVAYVVEPVTFRAPEKRRSLFGCSCRFSPTPARSMIVATPRLSRILVGTSEQALSLGSVSYLLRVSDSR